MAEQRRAIALTPRPWARPDCPNCKGFGFVRIIGSDHYPDGAEFNCRNCYSAAHPEPAPFIPDQPTVAAVVRWLREHQNSYSWRNHDLAGAIEAGEPFTAPQGDEPDVRS